MTATVRPLTVPGDKSIAHRALLLAALAHGDSRLRNVPAGLDVRSTRHALRMLGVGIRDDGDTVVVSGARGNFVSPDAAVDCGNSGTTLRLLTGLLCTRAIVATLDGDASLRARPMRRVAEPLAAFGAQIELAPGGTAPLVVRGNPAAAGASVQVNIASAQVKSAVLLAALGAHGRTNVGGLPPTRDHTERLLEAFGVRCIAENGGLALDGPAELRATDLDVPGDFSSAAFLLAAAAVVPGGHVVVDDVGLNPSRTAFLDVLRRFGADVAVEPAAVDVEPRGRITVRGALLHAIAVEPHEVPGLIDELPLVGVLGAFARGVTRIRGASELRVKESDRIASFAAAARALGVSVDTLADGFDVHGRARLHDGDVITHGDHRIAMAFSVAARAAGVEARLDDAGCIAVSFPGFAAALDALA